MANKIPSPTEGMTFPHPKPDTPPSLVKKIGKTTYLSGRISAKPARKRWRTKSSVCSARKSAK